MKKSFLYSVGLLLSSVALAQSADQQISDYNTQALSQLEALRKTLAPGAANTKQPKRKAPEAASAPRQAAAPIAAQSSGQGGFTIQQIAKGGRDSAIDEAAFLSSLRSKYPLTPEQILRLRQAHNATKYAIASSPSTPPRPVATSQLVNLDPGSTPPVIRLSQGFVSSLVFVDSTGAPWPIAAYDLGDPTSFSIQWDKSSNTLMIQATKLYKYGNLAVRLRGLNTPVMLTLIPGQKTVDYRVDLRIRGFGPKAKALPTGRDLPAVESPILMSILDGVAPGGAKRLRVSGGPAEAWSLGSKMFIRTRMTLLSPGWVSTVSSADGMHVYEINRAPILLVSENGKIKQYRIEGL